MELLDRAAVRLPTRADDQARASRALEALEGGLLCGLGAAWLLTGGRVALPDPVPVAYPHHVARPGVRQLSLAADDMTVWQGMPCTAPARTACDLLRAERRLAAVTAVDALMNRCLVPRDDISAELLRFKGRRGHPRALTLLPLTEPNSQSAPETKLRLCLVDGGLPRPVSQMIMLSPGGCFAGRADLGYELLRLAIEYLGRVHEATLDDDWDRLASARDAGYECVGVTAGTLRQPAVAVRRVLEGVTRQQRLLGIRGGF